MERRLKGNLINAHKYLKGGCNVRARLFLVVPSDRTRDNRDKLKHRRVSLNIRKHFFTVGLTEHWHGLPREVMVYPLLAHSGGTVTYSIESNLLSTQLQSWKKSSEFPQDLVPTSTGVFLWKPRGLRAG